MRAVDGAALPRVPRILVGYGKFVDSGYFPVIGMPHVTHIAHDAGTQRGAVRQW